MKKLFAFAIALCCAVLTVQADPLPNGLEIKIGSKTLTTDNCQNVRTDELTSGHIFYDVESATLTLQAVTLSSSTVAPLISISGGDSVIIVVNGYNTISTTATGGNAIEFRTPVIMTSHSAYSSLYVTSYANRGIVMSKDLTVKGGLDLEVSGSAYGIIGELADSKYPTIKVDGSKLVSSGASVSVVDVQGIGMVDSEWASDMSWDDTSHQPLKSGSPCTDLSITPASLVYYVYLRSYGFGGGKMSILKDGQEVSNPFKNNTGGAVNLQLKVEDDDQFTFVKFYDSSTDNPRDITSDGAHNEFDVVWSHKLASEKPWYIVTDDDHMFTWTYSPTSMSVSDLGEVGELATNKFKTGCAVKAGSDYGLIYAAQDGPTMCSVIAAEFDPEDVTTSSAIATAITSQSAYNPIYAVVPHMITNTTYFIAKKVSDSKTYLLMEDPENAHKLKEVRDLGTLTGEVACAAVDKDGDIYYLVQDDYDASLYVIGYGLEQLWFPNEVGKTGAGAKGDNQLGFDPFTDELIWLQNDGISHVVRVIDLNTALAYRVAETPTDIQKPRSMSQLVDFHKVTVAVADGCEEQGGVFISALNTTGYFAEGVPVVLHALPEAGCRFVKWMKGDEEVSTDADYTLTVGNADATYKAVFDWAEGVTAYPIWVAGKQFHTERLSMDYFTNAAIKHDGGKVTFNPETKTLTLDNASIEAGKPNIVIGEAGDGKKSEVVIRLVGDNSLFGTNADAMRLINTEVTLSGSGKISVTGSSLGNGVSMADAVLTVKGISNSLISGYYGLEGENDNTKLIVEGSSFQLNSSSQSAKNLAAFEKNYCDITYPSASAAFVEADRTFKDGSTVCNYLTFTAWPTLRVEPAEENTGSFKLKSGTAEFTNVGWFQQDDEVTITPEAADGFEFGFWMDDSKWNDTDPDKRMAAERKFTKTAGTDDLSARFYFVPKSSATWYGANNGKFVSFNLSDHGLEVAKASTPSASSVKAGDYTTAGWVYQDGSVVKLKEFSGIEDGEEMAGEVTELATGVTINTTDIAFNFSDNATYAVDGTKLYRVNDGEGKLDELGAFEVDETPVTGVKCIAINGKGDIYVLKVGADPILYTVNEIDEDGKKVKLSVVGENGKLGVAVTDEAQSLAFDHITGELFLGANDFLRIISLEDAKTSIVASLGWDKTAQKVIKAMHRKTQKITVRVFIAGEHDTWGTATANNKSSVSVLENTKVTLKATPAEGYEFKCWTQSSEDGEEVSKDATFEVVAKGSASKNKYYAHFKKQEQGIDEVESSNTQIYKFVKDGQLYIIRDGRIYNAAGQLVK